MRSNGGGPNNSFQSGQRPGGQEASIQHRTAPVLVSADGCTGDSNSESDRDWDCDCDCDCDGPTTGALGERRLSSEHPRWLIERGTSYYLLTLAEDLDGLATNRPGRYSTYGAV